MKSNRSSVKMPGASAPKRVFIVEDHPVFRQGLVQMLNAEKDLSVCGQASEADPALKDIARLAPDLVLVDISLPGKSGLDLIKELRAVNRKVKILVVSMHDEALYADRVLRAGGDGYIMKQEDLDEIIHAIRDVLGGHIYVSEEVLAGSPKGTLSASKIKDRPLDQLSDSELEILELLGRGKSNQEIARQLSLNLATVTANCAQIKKRLNLKSAIALLRYAVCWVETGEA
jgi:DNA-binding NarL/FixJ family response regulator